LWSFTAIGETSSSGKPLKAPKMVRDFSGIDVPIFISERDDFITQEMYEKLVDERMQNLLDDGMFPTPISVNN